MRRMVLTSLALMATALGLTAVPSAPAADRALTVKLSADWIGSKHQIFVDTTWTPKRFQTQVTVKISVNGQSLRTLQVKHWVIGRKLFKLTVPESVAEDSKARIEVRIRSEAGTDQRSI